MVVVQKLDVCLNHIQIKLWMGHRVQIQKNCWVFYCLLLHSHRQVVVDIVLWKLCVCSLHLGHFLISLGRKHPNQFPGSVADRMGHFRLSPRGANGFH